MIKAAWKVDCRPQRGGWAPGEYVKHCGICRCTFIGDKRACHCADCAYAQPHDQIAALQAKLQEARRVVEQMKEYLSARRRILESCIAADRIGGHELNVVVGKRALSEITAMECQLNHIQAADEFLKP